MARPTTTDHPDFYDAPAEQLARELPGELVLTPWQLLAVKNVTAYRGLARSDMQTAFDAMTSPVEGKWCVTPVRNGSNLNVTGKDASSTPQLASVSLASHLTGEDVTLPQLARAIAEIRGDAEPKGTGVRDYLTGILHDKPVFDPQSPLRFIPNRADPLPGRRARIEFTVAGADELKKFKNRVGVGVYKPDGVAHLDKQGTWELLLDQIAQVVGAQDRFALASDLGKFNEALARFPMLRAYIDGETDE